MVQLTLLDFTRRGDLPGFIEPPGHQERPALKQKGCPPLLHKRITNKAYFTK
jgi:hypothetical protein